MEDDSVAVMDDHALPGTGVRWPCEWRQCPGHAWLHGDAVGWSPDASLSLTVNPRGPSPWRAALGSVQGLSRNQTIEPGFLPMIRFRAVVDGDNRDTPILWEFHADPAEPSTDLGRTFDPKALDSGTEARDAAYAAIQAALQLDADDAEPLGGGDPVAVDTLAKGKGEAADGGAGPSADEPRIAFHEGEWEKRVLDDGTDVITYKDVGDDAVQRVLSVTVDAPFTHKLPNGTKYALYRVTSLLSLVDGSVRECVVAHRFSQFHEFRKQLSVIAEQDEVKSALPEMPPKTLLTWGNTSQLLDQRTRQFGDFFTAFLSNAFFMQRRTFVNPLLAFLRSGEVYSEEEFAQAAHKPVSTVRTAKRWVGRALFWADQQLHSEHKEMDPGADWNFVCKLMKDLKVSPKKSPWRKLVVPLFGPTSSGKSSLVNFIMTVTCAVVGRTQVDTGFTLYETVPEPEFRRYGIPFDFDDFTPEQLRKGVTADTIETDRRHSQVYRLLDTEATLERYAQQFMEHREWMERRDNIRCVLVNERYIHGDDMRSRVARSVILVDSKGIDPISAHQASLLGEGKVTDGTLDQLERDILGIQAFIRLADTSLFLVPADNVSSAGAQVTIFEMATLCSKSGAGVLKQRMADFKRQRDTDPEAGKGEAASGSGGMLQINVGAVLGSVLGVNQLAVPAMKAVNAVAGFVGSYFQKPEPSVMEAGNLMWGKVKFIISKADATASEHGVDARSVERELYYALGRMFGTSLNYLEPPIYGMCYPIAMPGPGEGPHYTGALNSLMGMFARNSEGRSYERSLDEAIVSACNQLLPLMTGVTYYRQVSKVQRARELAKARLKMIMD